MRIERNISYLEGRQLPYQIRVERAHQFVNESYATYEEAVNARDEIESNYLKTSEIAHSCIYENGKLKAARSRYQSDNLRKTLSSSGKKIYAIDTVCKQCNQKHTYQWARDYHQFLDRGEICHSCLVKNNYDRLLDARNSNDEPNSNNFLTGVKNVTFDKTRSRYRVFINRQKSRFSQHADTLNEAIAIKESVLNFYKEFDRLPTPDEV